MDDLVVLVAAGGAELLDNVGDERLVALREPDGRRVRIALAYVGVDAVLLLGGVDKLAHELVGTRRYQSETALLTIVVGGGA